MVAIALLAIVGMCLLSHRLAPPLRPNKIRLKSLPPMLLALSHVSDLSRSPMIVPLKILHGHGVVGGLGVLSVTFHPKQPWVFTAGADGVINLFQDI